MTNRLFIPMTPDVDLIVAPAGHCYFGRHSDMAASLQHFITTETALAAFNDGALQWENAP